MSALPVLMYHHVTPQPGLVTVSPEIFRSHMAWLAEHGYRSVGTEDLAGFLAGRPLAPKSVLITFDDGYLDNYVYAHPVLAEFGLKAVLFLVTGWVGDGPVRPCLGEGLALPETPNHRDCMARIDAGASDTVMLRWSEVGHMAEAGTFEFHTHTHTHTRWDKIEGDLPMRRERLRQDLLQSRETLVSRLGQCSGHLCWPQGYYDASYLQVARECGFNHLYTTHPGTVVTASSALELPRIVVKDKDAGWLGSRMRIYSNPLLARIYGLIKGY